MKPLQQQGLEWPGTRRSKLQAHSVQMRMQAIAARVQHWRQRRSGRREVLETLQWWWSVEALREETRKDKLNRKAAGANGGVQRATVQEENLQWWTVEALDEAKKQDSGGLS